jgi:uncharacterized protein
MRISLDELRTYPQHKAIVDFKENIDELDAVKPVLGEISISLNQSGVRVSGKVQTLLKLSCHRCLRPYFQTMLVELDERFVYASLLETPRERELRGGDDFVEVIPKDGIIDISDVIRQAITLATPTYCLCGEECPGLPQKSSAADKTSLAEDKNQGKSQEKRIDPRWKNLKTLFSTDEKGENS